MFHYTNLFSNEFTISNPWKSEIKLRVGHQGFYVQQHGVHCFEKLISASLSCKPYSQLNVWRIKALWLDGIWNQPIKNLFDVPYRTKTKKKIFLLESISFSFKRLNLRGQWRIKSRDSSWKEEMKNQELSYIFWLTGV